MEITDNQLNLYAKYIDFTDVNDKINEFKSVLEFGISIVKEHLKKDFEFKIGEFGSILLNTIATENEPISFYVNIYDNEIYENVLKVANSKLKKTKLITTDSIKLLLALYLDKYFGDINNVKISRNCITINSIDILGFNASVYIFASNHTQNVMLDSFASKLITADLEYYYSCFTKKIENTNYNILEIINIFKNYANKYRILENSFIIETLLYNVPNEYFIGDLRNQLIIIINYLKFVNIYEFKSLFVKNELITKDMFISNSLIQVKNDFDKFFSNLRN